MPSAREHEAWAQANERMYARLGGDAADAEARPWALTVLFYALVHVVQAHLVRKEPRVRAKGFGLPIDHRGRKDVLDALFKRLLPLYETLEDRSRQARYDCITPTPRDLKDAEEILRRARELITQYK